MWTGRPVNAGDLSPVTRMYPNVSLREAESAGSQGGHLVVGISGLILRTVRGPAAALTQRSSVVWGTSVPSCGGIGLPRALSTVQPMCFANSALVFVLKQQQQQNTLGNVADSLGYYGEYISSVCARRNSAASPCRRISFKACAERPPWSPCVNIETVGTAHRSDGYCFCKSGCCLLPVMSPFPVREFICSTN